jgi:hypothetical protein
LRGSRRDVGTGDHRGSRDLIACDRRALGVLKATRVQCRRRAGRAQRRAARPNEIVDGPFGSYPRAARRTRPDVALDLRARVVRQRVVDVWRDERIDGGAIRH